MGSIVRVATLYDFVMTLDMQFGDGYKRNLSRRIMMRKEWVGIS
jgi:hypothetical protein